MADASDSKAICVKGGGGLLLPLFGDGEQEWPRGIRVILYLIGLFWCFMGVSIIADVFMLAIEKVTSKKVRLYDKKKQKFYTFEVWNATVANLTLMALGSSAPEILLNVIDIFAREFFLEGLGPSTIVGSAAFNLLMIIAVCIISIPDGQVRYIKDMTVYVCTATWSVFAYIWLIIILLVISPHIVEVWEGVITFLFFPILTFMAWMCDKGYIGGGKSDSKFRVHADMSPEELAEVYTDLRKTHGASLSDAHAARLLVAMGHKPRSRAQYRVNASRSLFGGKGLDIRSEISMLNHSWSILGSRKRVAPTEAPEQPMCTFSLPVLKIAVLESCGHVVVKVTRGGDVSQSAEVKYATEPGSATAGDDYEHVEGWLKFEADEVEKEVPIRICDDESTEEDEHFFFKLLAARSETGKHVDIASKLSCAQIFIIDDDDIGVLSFGFVDEHVVKGSFSDFILKIPVQRSQGACGEVKCKYHTEGDTAVAGKDFTSVEGELVFENNQIEATIEIPISGSTRLSSTDRLRLFITDAQGGAKFDETRDGGEARNILTIMIGPDEEAKQSMDRVRSALSRKWEKSTVSHANWASQFKDAITIHSGDDDGDDGDGGSPSYWDYAMHAITVPWKLLFAFVPPTDYCGGWVCFFCALIAIGFVTMIINDMASLLGCSMCISDEITAITFVALGTSLPDTFASITAAKSEPHADSSVGNVTGSNSVNVFLGLGLPWMIAAISWAVRGGSDEKWQRRFQFDPDLDWLGPAGSRPQAFVVKAGSLAFSVTVFTVCAVICIAILALRRRVCGGELGGRRLTKYLSSATLTALWFLYIALSCWKSVEEAGGSSCAK